MHKIVLAVGGTGGHVFPALALAEELKEKYGYDVHFAGGKLSKNPYFRGESCSLYEVSCGKLSKNPLEFIRQSYSLFKGVRESIKLLKELQPDVVIGFGSYYSLPVLIAAKWLKIKVFLHEANSVPGRVNRLLSRFADQVWVQFPSAGPALKANSKLGGLPIRKNLKKGIVSQAESRTLFQLDPKLLTILVLGGSQGARKLNCLFSEAVLFHLRELLPPFQVIHSTGSHAETELLMARYVSASVPAYVRPFIGNMQYAWSAADISITRAGAGTIVEQYEFEVPSILMPYPDATDHHQDLNADFLEKSALAKKVNEATITPQGLAQKIQELYINSSRALENFKVFKENHRMNNLAEEIIEALK